MRSAESEFPRRLGVGRAENQSRESLEKRTTLIKCYRQELYVKDTNSLFQMLRLGAVDALPHLLLQLSKRNVTLGRGRG